MNQKTLSFIGIIEIALVNTLLSVPTIAADFNFSFNNELNGGGIITGIIRGLNEGTGEASSLEIFTNTIGFGIGEYIGNPNVNSWTVSGENIVAFNFLSGGILNTSPDVTEAVLFFDSTILSGTEFRAGLTFSPISVVIGNSFISTEDINLTFTPVITSNTVSEPSMIISLGMLTIFGIKRCFKRKSLKTNKIL